MNKNMCRRKQWVIKTGFSAGKFLRESLRGATREMMGNVPHARLFYDEIQCIGSNHMMLPFRCSETHVTQT